MDNKEKELSITHRHARTTKCLKYMILCTAVLWIAVLTPEVF